MFLSYIVATTILYFLFYNLVCIGIVSGCVRVVIANGEYFTDKPRLVVKSKDYIMLPPLTNIGAVKETIKEMVMPGKSHVA
jgi:hypothetical protein